MAMSVNWYLAITLVHELAHQCWFLMSEGTDMDEPFFNKDDRYSELGVSWQASIHGDGYAFGRPHRTYGLLFLHFEPNFRSNLDNSIVDNKSFCYPLCPLWVHSFFLRKTWKKFNKLSGLKKKELWYVPKPRVAMFYGPLFKFGKEFSWVWLSSTYPDYHRRSIQYWLDRMKVTIKPKNRRDRKEKWSLLTSSTWVGAQLLSTAIEARSSIEPIIIDFASE